MKEKTEPQPIHKTNWNHLIILDACRYDVFKEIYEEKYKEEIGGKLNKIKSRGSSTPDWLSKTFIDQYPYTYISANPFINSLGLPLSKTSTGFKSNWNPSKTFKKVIDLWNTEWNESKQTVLPEKVMETAKEHKEEKTIIHLLQPHAPFLTADLGGSSWMGRKRAKAEEGEEEYSTKRKILDIVFKVVRPIWRKLPETKQYKIRKILGIQEYNPIIEYYQKGKIDEIKKYYKENLDIAMEEVTKFIEKVPKGKKVIITADHGEAFGEQGNFGHPQNSDNPVLREVPWLEIEK
ncbi:MAG: hypothetical protein ACOCTT_03160 [archaeon]